MSDEEKCEECGHSLSLHGPKGCEAELGDGYRCGREYQEALGPCRCTAYEVETREA